MAYECKYGKLKTPSKKGRTVRICRRKKRTKKCAKKVCKYGKLKTPSKKGKCCKRKPKTLQIPESIHNGVERVIGLSKQYISLKKKIKTATDSLASETKPVKKIKKQIKLAEYTKQEDKLNERLEKAGKSLNEKLQNFINRAKDDTNKQLRTLLVQKVQAEMNKKIDSIA